MSYLLHFLGICLEYAIVVGSDVIEHSVDFFRQLFAIFCNFFSNHLDAAERADTSLQRLICLQTNDNILARNDVARFKGIDSHDSAGVNLQSAAGFSLFYQQFLYSVGAFGRSCGRTCQEAVITIIRMIV